MVNSETPLLSPRQKKDGSHMASVPCLHTHARGGTQCREYGRNHRRYDLQRPLQSLLL